MLDGAPNPEGARYASQGQRLGSTGREITQALKGRATAVRGATHRAPQVPPAMVSVYSRHHTYILRLEARAVWLVQLPLRPVRIDVDDRWLPSVLRVQSVLEPGHQIRKADVLIFHYPSA